MPEDYLACHDSEVILGKNGLRSVILMIAWLWRGLASSQPPEELIPLQVPCRRQQF